MNGGDPGQRLVFLPVGAEHRLEAAFFDIDDRIFRVGRKADGRRRLQRQIVLQVLAAGLLSAAQNQPAALGEIGIQFSGGLQRPHGHHGGALVIGGTAAVDPAILHRTLIGRESPAAALTDHIQMGQDAQIGRLVIQLGSDHIVVKVFGAQAQFLSHFFAFQQRGAGSFAKGHTGFGLLALAFDADQAADIRNDLLLLVCKIGLDFFAVHWFVLLMLLFLFKFLPNQKAACIPPGRTCGPGQSPKSPARLPGPPPCGIHMW